MPDNSNNPDDITGHRPTWAEIDLDALAANFDLIKKRVGSGVKVMAIVKANAYGHGAIECSRRLARAGAEWFGVALPEEGSELRGCGITQPILCLAGFWHGQEALCIQQKLVPVVYRRDMFEALDRAARDAGVIADVHVKIDTGMGRLGFRFDEVNEIVNGLGSFNNIRIDGLMTHFAAADDPSCTDLTEDQIERFEAAANAFRSRGFHPQNLHLANSPGIYTHPAAWENMIRPGGVLYGLWRDILPPSEQNSQLQPVMSLRSRIILLKWVPPGETIGYGCTFEASRKTLVATLPIGYDDGYLRGLSNRGHVIIRGTLAPVAGRVSMDLTLIDVTNVEGVELNDQVTLMGRGRTPERQAGSEIAASPRASKEDQLTVTAEDLAKIAGTLSYEVTCGIGPRVPRIYVSK